MVICLELGADLHMAQLMPLPLTVSCFFKIQIGFTFLIPAHPGSLEKRAVKRVCVCPGVPRWAGTRKVKPTWILLKQETVSDSGSSWAVVCTSLQTDNHVSTPPLSFFTGWIPFLPPSQQQTDA